MTQASIGYLSRFALEDPVTNTLVDLDEVLSIPVPNDASFDDIEVTHLRSSDRRREYIRGMRTDRQYEVVLNYVAGSATDTVVRACAGTDDTYDARIQEYDGFSLVQTHTFQVRNVNFEISDLETNSAKTMTLRFRLASAVTTTPAP